MEGTGSNSEQETQVGADAPSRLRSDGPLERGATVDRYVVLSMLGAGSMGVVYAAYDPELDRKVALKLLRPDAGGQESGRASARLLREAQALAKLSHPNVVAIHDVGARGGEVWLAMELVQGQTLTEWLGTGSHTWAEILAAIRPVAVGLAAAHAVDLVHRDIKPGNVMVGDDGRVRVMDFGLALGATSSERGEQLAVTSSGSHRLDARLTQAGATPGTPAYMAPEQLAGRDTDGRTDQFSLCVMLWEAVYGQRPFAGESSLQIASNVLEGRRAPPPRGRVVPRWLRRVIDRGLAIDPADRWPSIDALLAAIDRRRRRARLERAGAVTGVVALGVGGVMGARHLDERARVAACEAEGAALADTWNDESRAAVRRSILESGAGHATTTADKVIPWLDAQVSAWRSARIDTCLDAEVRRVWDADTRERATWCLDDRRLRLSALIDRLREADIAAVTAAVPAVVDLPSVTACRDAAWLSRHAAAPVEHRDDVQRVRAEISSALASEAMGAYASGLSAARAARDRAEVLQWPPLVAAGRHAVGRLLAATGAFEEAVTVFESAYFEAAEAGATEARDAYRDAGREHSDKLAEAEAWLSVHTP